MPAFNVNKKVHHIISYGFLAGFALYWGTAFLLALPPNPVKHHIVFRLPTLQTFLGGTWNFFTPPYPYNNRLYYIIRDTTAAYHTDTIEVLEELAHNKQQAAPFNQRQAVLDHQVNNILTVLVRTTWRYKTKPGRGSVGNNETDYVSQAMQAVAENEVYKNCLATLYNYARRAFLEKGLDLRGKELKIIVREKQTIPMQDRSQPGFVPSETTVLETPFKLIAP